MCGSAALASGAIAVSAHRRDLLLIVRHDDVIVAGAEGLYCPAGGFFLDPWAPVARAVISHAHADHVTDGCGESICSRSCEPVLRLRLSPDARITAREFGEPFDLGRARVSLHPAGHILGSAQVRVEAHGRVAVYTGDYKVAPDPTAEAFELVACDQLVTESTFALPIYKWPGRESLRDAINAWWRESQAQGRSCIVFAYALGKAQRVLHMLDPSIGPILVHGAVARFLPAFRAAGVDLPTTRHADAEEARRTKGTAMIVAPPSAARSRWARKFGGAATAIASGWMQTRAMRRRRHVDRGFVVSDHADWDGLLETVARSGAARVDVVHGYTGVLTRYLRERGVDAREIHEPRRARVDDEGGGAGEAGDEGDA